MSLFKIPAIVLFIAFFSQFGNAQVAIGYANFENIFNAHPQSLAMSASLEKYKATLGETIQVKQKYIRELYSEYIEKRDAGVAEETLKELEEVIVKLDNELKAYSIEAQGLMETKREELSVVILDDISNALEVVAKKYELNGILQPVNTEGVSLIVFAPEEIELTAEVIREIGGSLNEANIDDPKFSLKPSEISVGYTNVELILSSMTETKTMNAIVDEYREQLVDEHSEYEALAIAKFESYSGKKQSGSYSEKVLKELEAELMTMDAKLKEMAATMEEKSGAKQQELLMPILEKLQATIDKVASDNGFAFILNQTTSSGVSTIVYGPDNGDVTNVLCDELSIDRSNNESTKLEATKNIKVGYVNVELILGQLPELNFVKQDLADYETRMLELGDGTREEVDKKLADRQTELMSPIMTKIQTMIDEHARMKGYTYVLNQSGSSILFMSEEDDLTGDILNSLGVKQD